jgi:hypothetical protein
MTLAVSDDLYQKIKAHREVKWSEIARRAMWDYAMRLDMLDSITSKSTFTEKDAMEMDKKVKASLRKRYESQ